MVPLLFNPPRSPLKGDIPNKINPNKYPLYKVYMGLMIKGTIPRVPPFNPPYRMVTVFFLQRTEIRADFGHPNLQYLRKPSHVNKKLPETAFPQKMGYPWTEGNFVKKMFCVLFFSKKKPPNFWWRFSSYKFCIGIAKLGCKRSSFQASGFLIPKNI